MQRRTYFLLNMSNKVELTQTNYNNDVEYRKYCTFNFVPTKYARKEYADKKILLYSFVIYRIILCHVIIYLRDMLQAFVLHPMKM